MCGIAGFVSPDLNENEGYSVLEKMLKRIHHRGPDAWGMFHQNSTYLGHKRLSIIDLHEVSNQPFHRGDYTIVFNGEIYNYIEVRQTLIEKGHTFKTASDTEVILAAYEEYGSQCVQHFMGMWAFAILNKKQNSLFCSRDRFGIKPFYYSHSAGDFVFASEMKAVLAHPKTSKQINNSAISRYLQLGWIDNGKDTFFEFIQVLPPAHNAFVVDGNIKLERYWNIEPKASTLLEEDEIVFTFRTLLRNSVVLHNRSDVKVGACLSGGLDSSTLCAMMASSDSQTNFQAFHIFYTGKSGVDERIYAQEIQKRYANQIELHTLSPSENDLANHYDDFMQNLELPPMSSSPYSQYFVMKLAAQHGVKVVLDGQGADEYMAGYKHAVYRYLHDVIKQRGIGAGLKALKQVSEIASYTSNAKLSALLKTVLTFVFTETKLYKLEFKHSKPFVGINDGHISIQHPEFEQRLLQFLYHQLFQTSLNNLLYYEDRNSMRFSIESRVPFLDHRLPEFVFQNASNLLIKDGWSKYLLRKSGEPFLPESITYRRDKKGFVTPGEILWMNGVLKPYLMEPDLVFPENSVDKSKANKLKKSYQRGELKNADLVWRLSNFSYWFTNVYPKF